MGGGGGGSVGEVYCIGIRRKKRNVQVTKIPPCNNNKSDKSARGSGASRCRDCGAPNDAIRLSYGHR